MTKFLDRKSTRLNSSHLGISYAVFCLKKNNGDEEERQRDGESQQGPDDLLVDIHRHVAALFFFNDTATTEIYTLSLHDALPIYTCERNPATGFPAFAYTCERNPDRKSTRLNSSHLGISYAVFCLKKKKNSN